MEWKILDTKKAEDLHLKAVEGCLYIDIYCIPPGISIPEYVRLIQEQKIVLCTPKTGESDEYLAVKIDTERYEEGREEETRNI